MANLLRISEAASLAMHTLVFLAANQDRPVATREIAGVLRCSEAHLSKVLQRLSKAGLANSTRGPRGGFSLGRPADRISLLEIYQEMDGQMTAGDCLLGTRVCRPGGCLLGTLLEDVNHRVTEQLSRTKLSDLTDVFGGCDAD
jgi:Rrf2 family protein